MTITLIIDYNGYTVNEQRNKIMSDVFYAVQFRSMHTAIHSVAIFSLEQKAEELMQIMMATNEMPLEDEFEFEPLNFIDTVEIDFRKPLEHYPNSDDPDGLRLVYVNGEGTLNHIPDVYNY